VHQDLRTSYDNLNRIETLSDIRYNLTYSYDGAGNRTHIAVNYFDNKNIGGTQDLWYSYDRMNRVLFSKAKKNASDQLYIDSSQGAQLSYDARGLRTGELSSGVRVWIDVGYFERSDLGFKQYHYDGLGRLTITDFGTHQETREYDRASRLRLLTERPLRLEWIDPGEGEEFQVGVEALRQQETVYDDDGRVVGQLTLLDGKKESAVIFGDTGVTSKSVNFALLGNTTITALDVDLLGYDAAGVLRGYWVQVYEADGTTPKFRSEHRFVYGHAADTYLWTKHEVQSWGNGAPLNGETHQKYNSNDELIEFVDTRNQSVNRYFANNAQGQADV
jgi:hypothetical protein